MSLAGKGCIVTGGFGALGSAVTQRLAADGAHVAVIDHAKAPETAFVAFGGVDLADPVVARTTVEAAAAKLGGLYAFGSTSPGVSAGRRSPTAMWRPGIFSIPGI